MTDQQPPYEDVFDERSEYGDDTIDLDKHEPPAPRRGYGAPPELARRTQRPQSPQSPRPGQVVSQEIVPDRPEKWGEARIMRLAASAIALVFIILFVVTASRVIVWYLVWLPFLVGALPFLLFAYTAYQQHLKDESASRARWENWQQSRFDAEPLGKMDGNTERWG
jgi:hypothetical protein